MERVKVCDEKTKKPNSDANLGANLSYEEVEKFLRLVIRTKHVIPSTEVKEKFIQAIIGGEKQFAELCWTTRRRHSVRIFKQENEDKYSILLGSDSSKLFYPAIKKVLRQALKR